MKRTIAFLLLTCFLLPLVAEESSPQARKDFEWKEVSLLAMQDRGRMKPLDTFARESVQFITGKTGWKGLSSTEIVFGWLIAFEKEWDKEPFIKVAYGPVKKKLQLASDRQFFSPEELRTNESLKVSVREILQKQRRGEGLDDLEKKILQVQNQRALLEAVVNGQAFALIPHPAGTNEPWLALSSLTDRTAAEVLPAEQMEHLRQAVGSLLEAYSKGDAGAWKNSVTELAKVLSTELGQNGYPSQRTLATERLYNHLRPFRWAWIGYLLAFIFLTAFLVTKNGIFRGIGLGGLVGGFAIHTLGFVIRMLVSGRPPVTNMYESVIWVSWGCVLFALIIGWSYKKAVIPASASVFAIVALVLADTLPSVLDPSIQPLEPVLRSNFWLTIHVLTITLSYAAFALSLCLGNVVLGNFYFRPGKTEVIQYSSLYMYRAMQIGVVLLAEGTIDRKSVV